MAERRGIRYFNAAQCHGVADADGGHGVEVGHACSLPCFPCWIGCQRTSRPDAYRRISADHLSALSNDEKDADCYHEQVRRHRWIEHQRRLFDSDAEFVGEEFGEDHHLRLVDRGAPQ